MPAAQVPLSPKSIASLQHHVQYGAPSELPTERVQPSEESRHFTTSDSCTWTKAYIGRVDLPKLLNGFQPQDMDDKWLIWADGPDADGAVVVHFVRSWTGFKNMEAHLDAGGAKSVDDGAEDEEKSARGGDVVPFTKLVWTTDESRRRGNNRDEAVSDVEGVLKYIMGIKVEHFD